MNDKESMNFVKIELKKSSSTQKLGYSISIQAAEGAKQEMLDKLAEMSIKTALKSQQIIGGN